MRGASRPSYEDLRDQLDAALTSAGQARNVGDGLFAVTGLLDTEHGLRRALSDPGKPAAEKSAIANQLLHGKITQITEELVASAVEKRWASSTDLADAIEELGIESLARQAEYEGTLDDLEDELFRFARLVVAQPDLRTALASSAPAQLKETLLGTLLHGKVTPVALNLINQVVLHPRGRSLPHGAGAVRAGSRRPEEPADRRGPGGKGPHRPAADPAGRGAQQRLRAQNSPERPHRPGRSGWYIHPDRG